MWCRGDYIECYVGVTYCNRCLGEGMNPLRKWSLVVHDFQHLWMEMVVKLSPKERELAVIICRHLWVRRNTFTNENKSEDPNTLMYRAATQLEDYLNSNAAVTRGFPSKPTADVAKKWFSLVANLIKANWDATINSQQATTGLGGIFKHSNGEILSSFYNIQHLAISPILAELSHLGSVCRYV